MIKRNKYIEVHIEKDAREIVVIERKTKTIWKSNPPLLVATSKGKKKEDLLCGAKISCYPFNNGFKINARGKIDVKASILLQGNILRFRIDSVRNIPARSGIKFNLSRKVDFTKREEHRWLPFGPVFPDESMVDIEFPNNFGFVIAGEKGYLVIPFGIGALINFNPERKPEEIKTMFYWSSNAGGLSMAFFGVVRERSGMVAIIKTPFDAKLKVNLNQNKLYGVTPSFLFEAERIVYPREVDYHFSPYINYVDVAKTYRKAIIDSGKFIRLKEKVEKYPEVRNLIGAVVGQRRSLKNSYALQHHFLQGKKSGFDRVAFFATFNPTAPRAGRRFPTFKEVESYAKSLSPGFRCGVYVQFCHLGPGRGPVGKDGKIIQDSSILLTHKDGSFHPIWIGGDKLICTQERIRWAKQKLPEIKKEIGRGIIYVDIEGATPFLNCYHPSHPMTREQDMNYRRKLLSYVKKVFGAVATESLPHESLCDTVDIGAYFNIYPVEEYFNLVGASIIETPLIPVPLFHLVYHDSILSFNAGGWLEDWAGELLCYHGEPLHLPLYGMLPDDFSKRSFIMSRYMRASYLEEMVEHKFLTTPTIKVKEDLYYTEDVQMSCFADGTEVIANFSNKPYTYKRKKVSPKGLLFLINGKSFSVRADEVVSPIYVPPYYFTKYPYYLPGKQMIKNYFFTRR